MRKKLFVVSLALSALTLAGCSMKEPTSFEKGKQVSINNSLLEKQYNFVPKDPYLRSLNFAYEIYVKPIGAYLLPNHLIVKTFLLAHNSSKIVLVGGNDMLLEKYSDYFLKHGVNAEIAIQKIDKPTIDLIDGVQILFFNSNK